MLLLQVEGVTGSYPAAMRRSRSDGSAAVIYSILDRGGSEPARLFKAISLTYYTACAVKTSFHEVFQDILQ
jgi:hypothetical protein